MPSPCPSASPHVSRSRLRAHLHPLRYAGCKLDKRCRHGAAILLEERLECQAVLGCGAAGVHREGCSLAESAAVILRVMGGSTRAGLKGQGGENKMQRRRTDRQGEREGTAATGGGVREDENGWKRPAGEGGGPGRRQEGGLP